MIFNSEYKLHNYQLEGVEFLLVNQYAILADDCGIGKSIQALVAASKTGLKVGIVCPAYLVKNWKAEVLKFFPDTSCSIAFKDRPTEDKVLIMTYGQLVHFKFLLKDRGVVIFDECHYLKSPTAQRTENAHEALDTLRVNYVFALSGTPIKNRVPEFYTVLGLCSYRPRGWALDIMRDFNYWKFCKEFCHSTDISIKGRTVTKYFGVKNLDKLKKYLRGKYLRRNSEDILELPDIIFKEVILDVKEVKGLEEEWKTFSGGIPISTAKKESAISKAPKTAEYVRELLDTGLKVLVFTDHPDVGDIISETLIGYRVGISSGKVNALNRQGLIDSFQAGKLDVLVATIGSSSTGFNITSTNHVVFNDISWVDADNYQAIKRVHRIGQKNRVIVHYLLGGAIDAMILKAVKSKKNTLLEVL